jgi:hypothetical protein
MRGGVNDRRSRPIGSLRLRVGGGGGGAATGWPGPRARGGGGGSRVERLAGWRKDATRGGVMVGGFRTRAPGPAKARSAAAARDVCRRRSPAVAAAAGQRIRPRVGARCRVGWLHGHAGRRATPAAAWPMLLGADDTRVWVGVGRLQRDRRRGCCLASSFVSLRAACTSTTALSTIRPVVSQTTPCSLGLSVTRQQHFSLTTNQPQATSQQYSYLRTNQHRPSAIGLRAVP